MLLARLQLREERRACRLCVSLKFTSQMRMEKELMHEFRDCNKCCSLKQLQGLTQAWMKMSVVVINCW